MTRDQLLEVLREAIVTVLVCDPAAVVPEAHLQDDLDADSLALVEVIMAVEDRLDITVPEEDLKGITTVAAALDLLEAKVAVGAS